MITSQQNPRVKRVYALQNQAKARRKAGQLVLEGERLVRDAVERGGQQPDFVLYDPASFDVPAAEWLHAVAGEVLPVSTEVMRHISATEQPPGIIGVFAQPTVTLPEPLRRALILDAIRDPGNLGTLLRTAAAAGVEAVLLSPGCVDAYNPKVLRGAMGAHYRVAVVALEWADITAALVGLRVYLADMTGAARYDEADWSDGWALIVGSEAHGFSDAAAQIPHERVYVPMAADTESLNAAIAAGIILFEARRQLGGTS